MKQDISTYVEKMCDEMGLTLLPEEERLEVLSEIGEVLFQLTIRRMLAELNEEAQKEMVALLEQSADSPENAEHAEAFDTFVTEHVQNPEELMRAAWEELKSTHQSIFETPELQ